MLFLLAIIVVVWSQITHCLISIFLLWDEWQLLVLIELVCTELVLTYLGR